MSRVRPQDRNRYYFLRQQRDRFLEALETGQVALWGSEDSVRERLEYVEKEIKQLENRS